MQIVVSRLQVALIPEILDREYLRSAKQLKKLEILSERGEHYRWNLSQVVSGHGRYGLYRDFAARTISAHARKSIHRRHIDPLA